MRKPITIKCEFIELLPSVIEPETLYVSLKYKNMVHLCFCGCGRRVITPLSPTGWTLTYDGREASVSPSVGNWNLPCRSHYWITKSRVEWVTQWSEERIAPGFSPDRAEKKGSYHPKARPNIQRADGLPEIASAQESRSLWDRVKDWIK